MTNVTMSFSTSHTATTRTDKPAAGRLPARAALAAIALLLLGGGWYGYQYTRGTAGIPMAKAGDFLPDASGPRVGFDGRIRPAPAPIVDGVTILGNAVIVHANGATLRANVRPDGKWQLTVNRPGQTFDRQAAELVLQTRRRILEPRKPQADLQITDAQRATLAAAVPDAPPELTPDAFARATDLLGQLTKLPPTDPKAAALKAELQQIVSTISKADANAVAQEYNARAAKIRATLSAEQVQTLLDLRAARPTVAPATKPVGK